MSIVIHTDVMIGMVTNRVDGAKSNDSNPESFDVDPFHCSSIFM